MEKRQRKGHTQSGLTMIELLIAMTVLVVGMGGTLLLFTTAIANNNKSKIDTQAVGVSQMVMELFAAAPASKTASLTITDCAANSHSVSTAVDGSTLDANGNIDWTQPAVANYWIPYVTCGPNGVRATYEVRWNISTPYPNVKLIAVSSRLKNAQPGGQFFSIPTTLRTMTGQ